MAVHRILNTEWVTAIPHSVAALPVKADRSKMARAAQNSTNRITVPIMLKDR